MLNRFVIGTFLPPANEVCEGYVFTPVCQSFCSRGGGFPQCMLGYPPETRHPPRSTPTPGPGNPLGPDSTHRRSQHPREQTPPPGTRHSPGSRPPLLGSDTPSAQCMLGDTVNERAARILLECNLVFLLL